MGSPLTIFVPHAVEALLNLNSQLPYFLRSPVVNVFSHNSFTLHNLNSVTLLPAATDKVSHDCLTLMGHILTLCDDLQEISLGNTQDLYSLLVPN